MFCPKCEVRRRRLEMSDCGVSLVDAVPEETRGEEVPRDVRDSLVRIPLESASDAAPVQSLLRSAGFQFHVNPGFGEVWDEVWVRKEDVPAIKEFLNEYRSQQPLGHERLPIRW